LRPIRLWERGKDIKEGQLFRAKEISVEGHRGIELVPVEDEKRQDPHYEDEVLD